ncbi:thioester reductase domain protein [Aspergillus parasiticus SU-1]|uniref:Thioester reductase domain protein n=1 Tax=Aspergillus parasiticus (strain ATCC 56775 / NRRL 5862 / SRRC 143 / SU-1) TaxID=1403190 RepID=A0A0F0I766_ASPPU|nr:thioester reductase domain protein [Aspergillus parasiticus SU-1]
MKGNVNNGEAEDRGEDVQATLKHITNKYTNSLPKVEHQTIYVPAPSNIILTGSTGSLGSYLLDVLFLEPSIKKVYCLNRSSDAFERQIFSFHDRQVNVKLLLSPKAEFLTTNLGGKTLGLSQSKYNELLNKTDAIVHNAWKVDFNLSVHSFKKDHIRGTRNLLNLSISSRKAAHMYFISSIATTSSWDPSRGKIPEDILPDTVEPPLQGSRDQQQKSGGYWNPDEWFPSLVSTSKSMCSIPKWLGMLVEWIPVNTLAQVVLEIIQCGKDSKKSIPASVINLVNPTRTTWATLLPTIQRRIGANPVSLQSWVRALGETDAVNVGNRPAYKLLSFYERLARSNSDDSSPQFETNKASAASPTFRALGPIDSSLVHTWLDK